MNTEQETNRLLWEQRSSEHQNHPKGVLFKRFPDSLNMHIHRAQTDFILDNINDNPDQRILDAGCGYGRISLEILKKFPKADVCGMDVSSNYVALYTANTGKPAFTGNLGALPENTGKFDIIICAAVLMYVPAPELETTLCRLFKHLTENGSIIFIEPLKSGKIVSSGFGLLNLFSKQKSTTAGNCFSARALKKMIVQCGGVIVNERRMPVTTGCIIPLYILARIFRRMQLVYRFTNALDSVFAKCRLPSLHVFLRVEKSKQTGL
ncbi:MAG: class I SAM-dependent methyltransferase [Bacteroidota bacterium]